MARTRQSPFNSLLSIGCLGRAGKISEALNDWSLGSAGSLKKFFCALGAEEPVINSCDSWPVVYLLTPPSSTVGAKKGWVTLRRWDSL
jgi:hypothetical protein